MTQMLIGALARWALTIMSGYLVAHHVLTGPEGDALLSHGVQHAVIAAPALAALAWSLYQKYNSRVSFLTALAAPAGTSEACVQDSVAAGCGASLKQSTPIVLLACALGFSVASLPACFHAIPPPPTPIAQVADSTTKIEQSANAILHAAQAGNATIAPSTGQPLVSQQHLDDVAMAVYRIGRLGKVVQNTLNDYNLVKAAGRDLTLQREAVQKAISDVADALTAVGNAVPGGTLAELDAAVNNILDAIVQVRSSVGL